MGDPAIEEAPFSCSHRGNVTRFKKMRQAGARSKPTGARLSLDTFRRARGMGGNREAEGKIPFRVRCFCCFCWGAEGSAVRSPTSVRREQRSSGTPLLGDKRHLAADSVSDVSVSFRLVSETPGVDRGSASGRRSIFLNEEGSAGTLSLGRAADALPPNLAGRVDRWPALRKGPGRWDSLSDRGKVSG